MDDQGQSRLEVENKLEKLETLSPEAMRQHCLEMYKRELEDKVKNQDDVRSYALICAIRSEGVRARDRRVQEAAAFLAESSRLPTDYTYWGKAAYWTVEEACALLSGIRPTTDLRDEDILPLAGYAAPAKRFADLQRLLLRENNDSPYAKLRPSDVLAWARSLDIAVPQPLSDAVRRYATDPAAASGDEPLDPRERTTLLRIIRALAIMAKLPERGATGSIEKQLQELGFTGPKDAAIRKVLADARMLEQGG